MTYRVHVKTEFMELELREILQSPPGVLLGVSADAETTLKTIPVTTVYDLALARPFRDAAHVVEAATDPTSVVARHGSPPTDLAVTPALATALHDTMAVTSVRDLAQWSATAAAMLVTGMRDGLFTSHKLAAYDLDDDFDATNARAVVNHDTDTHGATVRELAKKHKKALIQIP
jgi:hypothetical protein